MALKFDQLQRLIPYEQVPTFSPMMSVAEAYRDLAQLRRTAFSVVARDTAYFIDGTKFLPLLLEPVSGLDIHALMDQSLHQTLTRPDVAAAAQPVTMLNLNAALEMPEATNLGQDIPFLVRNPLRNLGWLLQPGLARIVTQLPKYICENNHVNPDPDHGTCYSCPGKIVRVE